MIDYLNTLKRAHDHPKQRGRQFTISDKIKALRKLSIQYKPIETFNKDLGLPFNSLNVWCKQLREGALGIGYSDLLKSLSDRMYKMKSKHRFKTA
jgi:hypothetical protein